MFRYRSTRVLKTHDGINLLYQMTKSESQIKKGSVGNPCYGSAVNPVETELPAVLIGVQWSPIYFC